MVILTSELMITALAAHPKTATIIIDQQKALVAETTAAATADSSDLELAARKAAAEAGFSDLTTGGGIAARAFAVARAELEDAQRGTGSEPLRAQLLSESQANGKTLLLRAKRLSDRIVYDLLLQWFLSLPKRHSVSTWRCFSKQGSHRRRRRRALRPRLLPLPSGRMTQSTQRATPQPKFMPQR